MPRSGGKRRPEGETRKKEKRACGSLSVSTNGEHFSGDAGRDGKPLPMLSAAAACTPLLSNNPLGEAWRAEALQIQSEPGDMRGGFGSLAQQGSAYHTSAGMQEGAASPFHHIRSGGVYAARSGCKPLPLSCSARALRAQEHDVPFAARLTEQPCSERPSTCRRSERAVPVFPVSGRRKKFFQNATTLSPSRSF